MVTCCWLRSILHKGKFSIKTLLCQVLWVVYVSFSPCLSRPTGKRWISFYKPWIRSLQPSATGKKGLSRSVLLSLISWLPLKLNLRQSREKSWASAVTPILWLSSWHMWSWYVGMVPSFCSQRYYFKPSTAKYSRHNQKVSALLQHIPCCISTAAGSRVWQVKRCLGSKLYIRLFLCILE